MTGTAARYTGHRMTEVRWSTPISGLPSWIRCECAAFFTGMPDLAFGDPHEPLARRYQEHRQAVKAGPPKSSERGWERMSLTPERVA